MKTKSPPRLPRLRALVLALLLPCAPSAASAAGRVISATGALTAAGRALKPGDALPDAELRLSSGSAVLGIRGGRFLLKGPATFTPRRSGFRLDQGSLLSVLKHRPGLRFSVRTPTVVAAVRGTDFFVEVGPDKDVEVCICHGALLVSGKDMKPLTMASQDHLHFRFWSGAAGTLHDQSPLKGALGHTDAELDRLLALLAAEKP